MAKIALINIPLTDLPMVTHTDRPNKVEKCFWFSCLANFLPSANTNRQRDKQPQRDFMTGNTYIHIHTVILLNMHEN